MKLAVAPASPNAEHERRIALFDLKEFNSFAVLNEDRGPYVLAARHVRRPPRARRQRRRRRAHHLAPHALARQPAQDRQGLRLHLRQLQRGHPRRAAQPIEALDMGRRGLHNEAAEVLQELSPATSPSTTKPRGVCLRWSARCMSGRLTRPAAGVGAVCVHPQRHSLAHGGGADAHAVRLGCSGR